MLDWSLFILGAAGGSRMLCTVTCNTIEVLEVKVGGWVVMERERHGME